MTPTELDAAWRAAKPGSTLVIPPGNYGNPYIHDLKGVTFQVDPKAMFDGLTLYGLTDCSWTGGYFELPAAAATGTGVKIVRLAACHNLAFTAATVLGALATLGGPEDSPVTGNHLINGRPAGMGISVEFSSFVTVSGADISQAFKGIVLARCTDLTITDNHIHDFRTSGIVGDAPDRSLIARNHIHNARQWAVGGDGDHSEGIHMWNNPGDPASKVGLTISLNWIDQDAGDPFPIGMSFENKSGLGFDGCLIDRNTILNGLTQGINAFGFRGAITNNVLLQTSGDRTGSPSFRLVTSTAKVLLTPGVSIQGNKAGDLYGLLTATAQAQALGLPPMGNTIVAPGIQPDNVLAKARAAAKANLVEPTPAATH